jgi:hypothetical protein
VLTTEIIVAPAGTDWGAIIGAGLATVGTLAGVIIGGQGRRHAEADAVKRNAYAAYLTAVAPLLAHHKARFPDSLSEEDWRTLRAARYAAELIGSPQVADMARQLSGEMGEPQAQVGADYSRHYAQLILAMQADLRRGRRWNRAAVPSRYGVMGGPDPI